MFLRQPGGLPKPPAIQYSYTWLWECQKALLPNYAIKVFKPPTKRKEKKSLGCKGERQFFLPTAADRQAKNFYNILGFFSLPKNYFSRAKFPPWSEFWKRIFFQSVFFYLSSSIVDTFFPPELSWRAWKSSWKLHQRKTSSSSILSAGTTLYKDQIRSSLFPPKGLPPLLFNPFPLSRSITDKHRDLFFVHRGLRLTISLLSPVSPYTVFLKGT